MEIFAALNRDRCSHGSVFNVADGEVVSWSQVWPGICAYFGLEGAGLAEKPGKIEEFVSEHRGVWDKLAETNGLQRGPFDAQNWPFIHFMLVEYDCDRQYSLDAARSVGFEEAINTVQGHRCVFDRMVNASFIPFYGH